MGYNGVMYLRHKDKYWLHYCGKQYKILAGAPIFSGLMYQLQLSHMMARVWKAAAMTTGSLNSYIE